MAIAFQILEKIFPAKISKQSMTQKLETFDSAEHKLLLCTDYEMHLQHDLKLHGFTTLFMFSPSNNKQVEQKKIKHKLAFKLKFWGLP